MTWNGRLSAGHRGRCLAAVIALIGVAGASPRVSAEQGNVIKSIGPGKSGAHVEIELQSATEFAVRDELIVLRIGSRTFTRSRPPADGDLKRLIFVLPADEFGRLQPGETVTVEHGRGDTGPRQSFGPLTRSMLGK